MPLGGGSTEGYATLGFLLGLAAGAFGWTLLFDTVGVVAATAPTRVTW